MGPAAARIYRLVCYVMFRGVYLYAIGFIGNFVAPKNIDSGADGPLTQAILINLLLLSAFAVGHIITTRTTFKRWLSRRTLRSACRLGGAPHS